MTNVRLNSGSVVQIDENASLTDMQTNCPKFFTNKLYGRETYTTHMGCLILRGTITYTGCRPKRETVIYLYLPLGFSDSPGPDMMCVNGYRINSIREAKRLIDKILEDGSV